jgi:hypothetical protein
MRGGQARARAGAALAAFLVVSLTACSGGAETIERTGSRATGSGASGSSPSTAGSAKAPSGGETAYAVADPGALKSRIYPADLLVTGPRPIPDAVRRAVAGTRGVEAVIPLSLASLSANGRTLSIAAADPAQFRRFTAFPTASANEVWKRVAGGEVAVDPGLPRRLEEPEGYLRLGTSEDAPSVHIGAYAPIVKQISAVVNYKRGAQLGIPRNNALLVSTGAFTPSAVTPRLKRLLPPGTSMQTLALEFHNEVQTAVLSGTSVSDKVGTFSYTPHPDGTVTPQASWVRSYIRTEQVPILGSVTCNKGMLPQLRAALAEVVQRGLADKVHPGEYAGCYYPRYIAHDPAKGLSLHSWGIAVDLNTPGNQRGTVGEMDRQVVSIFKRWGFAWGGDWNYTDPMHFEMAKVVQAR